MADNHAQVLFREEQRFRQPLLWILVGAATGFSFWSAVNGLLAVFENTNSYNQSQIMAKVMVFVLVAAVDILVVTLFALAKLSTEVRTDGLYIKFSPFHFKWRPVPTSDATSVESVTYGPIKDYGGWGIRYGYKKKAYNVSGNSGIRITYAGGNHVLIGSHKSDELMRALHRISNQYKG